MNKENLNIGEKMRWRHGCKWMSFGSGDLLGVLILTVMLEKPTYGYSLMEKLKNLGIDITFLHHTVVYRILRMMEISGLVISAWDTTGTGPARRVYSITDAGREYLKNWYHWAKKDLKIMENIINEIEKTLKGGD
ncbi:MAG TPA: PadR family transcriptional regulator [bacterium]|nr:PadR family transcriptional regulator [bacterium]HOL34521.1 PadR family transcriptional regulator [bacterium]HPP08067.1 PadR family transcriptional regulator [bacterium]